MCSLIKAVSSLIFVYLSMEQKIAQIKHRYLRARRAGSAQDAAGWGEVGAALPPAQAYLSQAQLSQSKPRLKAAKGCDGRSTGTLSIRPAAGERATWL